MIGHLILVAGPSGAGKSTFMKRLSAGDLPHEIVRPLTIEAAGWPQTDCKTVLRNRTFLRSKTPRPLAEARLNDLGGLVCHYDIMRPFSLRFDGYPDDPGLTVLDAAKKKTIVSILPRSEWLVEQFCSRAEAERSHKSANVWRRFRNRLRLRDPNVLKPNHTRLLSHYRDLDWLQRRYEEWLAYVSALCCVSSDCAALRIDRSDSRPDGAAFRLCRL